MLNFKNIFVADGLKHVDVTINERCTHMTDVRGDSICAGEPEGGRSF